MQGIENYTKVNITNHSLNKCDWWNICGQCALGEGERSRVVFRVFSNICDGTFSKVSLVIVAWPKPIPPDIYFKTGNMLTQKLSYSA